MVVASHQNLANSPVPVLAWAYAHVFYEGYIGVTFFFILSGFILSYSYADRAEAGELKYSDFIFTRIARIVPLHLLTMLIALPLALRSVATHFMSASQFAIALPANAALLQAFVPVQEIYFSFNSPSWSLSVEMFFYALFPLLLALRGRWLAALALAVLLAKVVVSSVGSEEAIHFFVYVFPPLRLVDFVAGILLFRLYRVWPRPSVGLATVGQFAALGTLIVFFCFKDSVSQAMRFDAYYILPMALLVLSFAWQQGGLARAISPSWLVFLGEASFALYLVHQLVIRYGEPVRVRLFHGAPAYADVMSSAAYVLVSVALSALLFSRFEMRAKAWTFRTLQAAWRRRIAGRAPAIAGERQPPEVR